MQNSNNHNYKSTQKNLIYYKIIKIHHFYLSIPKQNYIIKLFLIPQTTKKILLTFP